MEAVARTGVVAVGYMIPEGDVWQDSVCAKAAELDAIMKPIVRATALEDEINITNLTS